MRIGILGSGLMGGKLDDTRLVVAHTSSGAEVLAKKAPGARVVSAFGTVPSEVLFARRPDAVWADVSS